MRELISHPPDASGCPIRLYDHLSEVGHRAAKLLLRLKSHLKLAIPCEEIVRAAFIVGSTHDFGKAKRQFQQYIWGGKGRDKEHAAISSIFAFIVALKVFGQKPQPARLLPFICAYAVSRHHGLLCNLEEAFEEATIEYQIAIAQNNIDERLWDFEFRCEPLGLTIRFSDYREQFETITADQIMKCFRKFGDLLRQKADESDASESWLVDLYFALLLIVSTLTEADVACVISAPEPRPAQSLDPERVHKYAFAQPAASPSFQRLRELAWEEIQKHIETSNASALRLTLPTGLGKTLMGLYLAGEVQQRRGGPNPVIYSLPYLSIIEQTTDVARRTFPEGESNVSVMQHHSLSFPDERNEGIFNFERARFALEDWDADLVITTFDQLFYSFLSSDRGFIRRFFRLPGATLLLDEVQTIPARLIPAVETFLQKLRQKLDIGIIYMTATHPPFLQTISSPVCDERMYFQSLNRTCLHLELDPMPFSDYISQLGDWLLQRKNRKILLVANTIRSAKELFAYLRRLEQDEPDFQELRLFHLSGSVVPVERLERIRQIRALLQENPEAWVVVASTQCVEAGVDLDMDEAVRDFAPWDSLLQICGRVNRFKRRSRANVWIHRWVDDDMDQMREFHSYIYDSVFTDATLSVLANRGEIDEEEYWEIQRKYVQELERRLSSEESRELLRSALAWRFDELNFQKLFRGKETAWKISVFCVADDTAEYLKEIAIELWSSKQPQRALELLTALCNSPALFRPLNDFLRIEPSVVKQYAQSLRDASRRQLRFAVGKLLQPMFQAYTISLPVRRLEELPFGHIAEGFPYLSRDIYQALNNNIEEAQGIAYLDCII